MLVDLLGGGEGQFVFLLGKARKFKERTLSSIFDFLKRNSMC